MFCIPKILKNESNSQHKELYPGMLDRCFVSQRYWKMKAIHNTLLTLAIPDNVVLYPKDTEKWKQFTTVDCKLWKIAQLFCIPKILKNESNSQRSFNSPARTDSCFVSQRYWKMKAIHNKTAWFVRLFLVVLYPKDTEKWKQFTTVFKIGFGLLELFCIPKILKNESNSQLTRICLLLQICCFVSQRYWKMKAIHN